MKQVDKAVTVNNCAIHSKELFPSRKCLLQKENFIYCELTFTKSWHILSHKQQDGDDKLFSGNAESISVWFWW